MREHMTIIDEPPDLEAREPAARRDAAIRLKPPGWLVLEEELALSDPLACPIFAPLASARACGVGQWADP